MAMTPRQTTYMAHLWRAARATGRLGIETAKVGGRVLFKNRSSRKAAFTAGLGLGAYSGYRVARTAQEQAVEYVYGKKKRY